MVIQSNMSPKAVVDVWGKTAEVFNKYQIPLTEHTLEVLVDKEQLVMLLQELNDAIGSSSLTCIEGG
ncbi:MAG TPA: hypothetical protein VJ558_02560 [Bacillales bacterium]|nr:hypothetical protein [Bacillales bacterium]